MWCWWAGWRKGARRSGDRHRIKRCITRSNPKFPHIHAQCDKLDRRERGARCHGHVTLGNEDFQREKEGGDKYEDDDAGAFA